MSKQFNLIIFFLLSFQSLSQEISSEEEDTYSNYTTSDLQHSVQATNNDLKVDIINNFSSAQDQLDEQELNDAELIDKLNNNEAINPQDFEYFNNEECEEFLNECKNRLAVLQKYKHETKTEIASLEIQDLIVELLYDCEDSIQLNCSDESHNFSIYLLPKGNFSNK